MFDTYFYNETFKRAVSIFGTLFNNISVKKTKADGTVLAENKIMLQPNRGYSFVYSFYLIISSLT